MTSVAWSSRRQVVVTCDAPFPGSSRGFQENRDLKRELVRLMCSSPALFWRNFAQLEVTFFCVFFQNVRPGFFSENMFLLSKYSHALREGPLQLATSGRTRAPERERVKEGLQLFLFSLRAPQSAEYLISHTFDVCTPILQFIPTPSSSFFLFRLSRCWRSVFVSPAASG